MGTLNIRCPSCRQVIACAVQHRGRKVQCPKCQAIVGVPKRPPRAPRVDRDSRPRETHGPLAGAFLYLLLVPLAVIPAAAAVVVVMWATSSGDTSRWWVDARTGKFLYYDDARVNIMLAVAALFGVAAVGVLISGLRGFYRRLVAAYDGELRQVPNVALGLAVAGAANLGVLVLMLDPPTAPDGGFWACFHRSTTLLAIAVGPALVATGIVQLLRLRWRRVVMAACIAAFYPCWLIGVPVGIWGLLVLLTEPQVKAAFGRRPGDGEAKSGSGG